MTLQDVFNRVWDHFVVQKAPPSVDEKGEPRYRGLNGAKCAIGVLLPDSVYTPDIEGTSVRLLVEAGGPFSYLARWANDNIEGPVTKAGKLLSKLQWAHDDAALFPDKFHHDIEAALRGVARAFDLEVPQ